jgi:anti-sigma B factor antagonist
MAANYLRVNAERRDGVCVLAVSGELDTVTAAGFADHVAKAVEGLPGPVLVDLSGLTFIDCCGARTLVAVTCAFPPWRPVTVRSCRPIVGRVLGLLGLDLDHLRAEAGTAPERETCELIAQVQEARSHSRQAISL